MKGPESPATEGPSEGHTCSAYPSLAFSLSHPELTKYSVESLRAVVTCSRPVVIAVRARLRTLAQIVGARFNTLAPDSFARLRKVV